MKTSIMPIVALAMVASAGASSAWAQTHPATPSQGSVEVINNDTVDGKKVFEIMKQNAPQVYNVPGVPRFALAGKDGKFYLGIGGSVKGTVSYDFGDPIDNANEFTTSAINMNPTVGNGSLVQFSGQQSSLFVNFIAMPDNDNQVGVYIMGNMLGNGYGFQLQQAYAKYRGFTVGYDFSLFTDAAAAPPTIDYEGPNALTAIPNAVIDYRYNFGKSFGVGIGAELPQNSFTTNASVATVNQRVPDIPAYVQYSWGDNNESWLRFSGILRNFAYRDVIAGKNRNQVGWGIKASGSATLCPQVIAYYQGAFGKGLSSYFQDINGLGLDMVPDAENAGRMDAVKAWGAYGGLQYNFSPKVYASATYSHVRDYAKKYTGGAIAWDDQYKYAQYVVGNVFYNPNSIISMGLEYIWGRRVDMSGLQHHDNRIQAMFQVSF